MREIFIKDNELRSRIKRPFNLFLFSKLIGKYNEIKEVNYNFYRNEFEKIQCFKCDEEYILFYEGKELYRDTKQFNVIDSYKYHVFNFISNGVNIFVKENYKVTNHSSDFHIRFSEILNKNIKVDEKGYYFHVLCKQDIFFLTKEQEQELKKEKDETFNVEKYIKYSKTNLMMYKL